MVPLALLRAVCVFRVILLKLFITMLTITGQTLEVMSGMCKGSDVLVVSDLWFLHSFSFIIPVRVLSQRT